MSVSVSPLNEKAKVAKNAAFGFDKPEPSELERLNSLPFGAVIIDFEGDAWQKGNFTGEWQCVDPVDQPIEDFAPFTVVYPLQVAGVLS